MHEPETLGLGAVRRSRRGGILAMEENLWIRSCSSASTIKRSSRLSSVIIVLNRKSSRLQNKMNITKKARELFEDADSLDFDIFDFSRETHGGELVALTNLLFEKHDLFKSLKISNSKFLNFTRTIQSGYKKVQYHNKTHGTDVAQTLYCFLMKGNWMTTGEMDTLDLL